MFLSFELYYQAKKHPIGGHVCLTYCLLHEALVIIAILLGIGAVWIENTLHPRSLTTPKTPLQNLVTLGWTMAIGFLVTLVFALAAYPYVRKNMEENGFLKEIEARKSKKSQGKK